MDIWTKISLACLAVIVTLLIYQNNEIKMDVEELQNVQFKNIQLENIQGKNWYTLRLDGHGFSKTIKQMRKTCLLPEKNGLSNIFASLISKLDYKVVLSKKLSAVYFLLHYASESNEVERVVK